MNQRGYDRFAAALSVGILAVLAAVSYYLAETSGRLYRSEQAGTPSGEPDYYVEQVALTKLNSKGEPAFRLSADRLVHYPHDQSSVFERPVLVSLEPDRPLVTLRAARGRSTNEGERTELFDDVVLTRAASAGKPALLVETEYVLMLGDEDVARTDRPVRISSGDSFLTGVGMEFNNSTRVLNVLSDVRGIWAAPPRR